jgi:hypothetical protein
VSRWKNESKELMLYDVNYEDLVKNSFLKIHNRGSKKYEIIAFVNPKCATCLKVEKTFARENVTVFYNFISKDIETLLKVISSEDPYVSYMGKHKKEEQLSLLSDKFTIASKEAEELSVLSRSLGISATPTYYLVHKKNKKVMMVIRGNDKEAIINMLDLIRRSNNA